MFLRQISLLMAEDFVSLEHLLMAPIPSAKISLLGMEGGTRITKKLNYLIIGAYATDAWIHSSYGRRIEKALRYRDKGVPISIVSEERWGKFV